MYEWLKINGIEPEEFEESEYDINLDISYDFFIRIISREHKTLNENETLEIKIGELKNNFRGFQLYDEILKYVDYDEVHYDYKGSYSVAIYILIAKKFQIYF